MIPSVVDTTVFRFHATLTPERDVNAPAADANANATGSGTGTCLDTLLEAARLAPSGDNTQAWRFFVDGDDRSILLDVDPGRDPSPMNAGQRMTRYSLGAVLENMARTAEHNGWEHSIDEAPESGVARIQVENDEALGEIAPLLRNRVTNRRVYDATEVPADRLARLQKAEHRQISGARVKLVTDPGQRSRLVRLIARGDSLMLSNRRIRDAFLAKVRFDAAPDAVVDEGLSLGSLEVSAVDRVFLRLLKTWSIPDGVMRTMGARRTFASVASRLAGSASGFCLITTTQPGPVADLHVGRAWQDIWLRLSDEGYASQPMMSLPVLQNIVENGDPDIFATRDQEAIRQLLGEFHEFAGEISEGRPAALMRFGQAPPPSTQVGRLPAEALCTHSPNPDPSQPR